MRGRPSFPNRACHYLRIQYTHQPRVVKLGSLTEVLHACPPGQKLLVVYMLLVSELVPADLMELQGLEGGLQSRVAHQRHASAEEV
eukprot:2223384-Amphidinium_carterae.1